ncbi:MAG: YncE family protein [Granulosicoccus sp.]
MKLHNHQALGKRSPLRLFLILTLALALISGCSSSGDDHTEASEAPNPGDEPNGENLIVGTPDGPQSLAFVSTRASDFSSGQLIRLSLTEGNIQTGEYTGTGSDIDVDNDSSGVYQVGRFGIDSITRFDPLDTSLAYYQLSVNGEDTQTANPQDLAFVDDSKGYLTRRNSDKLWIIDPQPDAMPATTDDFKLGEIDLGAYDNDLPNMTDAIIVDNKLFVLLERLNELPNGFQVPDKPGYVAVFDTLTDQEIPTGQSGNDLNGIRLQVNNPTALQYNESTGQIYVVGRGNFTQNDEITTDYYSGGVQVIDPTTYQSSLLLDDGNADQNNGYFLDGIVVSSTLAYIVTGVPEDSEQLLSPLDTQLRTFNPDTGALSDPISDPLIAGKQISVLAIGPDNHLWVGIDGQTPGFARIDLQNNTVDPNPVVLSLIPSGIAFLSVGP